MSKINFLKELSRKKIDFALLSSNSIKELRNNKKDLDIFIPKNSKNKFENILKKKNFFERLEKVRGYKDRKFYTNIKSKKRFLIDAYFDLNFRKNFFFIYKLLNQKNLIKTRKLKNGIYFTNKKYFEILFKAKNHNFQFKDNFSIKFNLFLNYKFKKKLNYILFIGSDGTGKTTQINYFLNKFFMKSIKYNLGLGKDHWFLYINFFLYNFFKFSFLKEIILIFDLSLRKLSLFRYSSNNLILIDRFPGYIFFKKNLLSKIIQSLLPKPDLIVLMTTQRYKRMKRKPEEFVNDEKKWFLLAKKIGVKYTIVDTTLKKISENYKFIEKKFLSNNNNFKNIFSKNLK